MLDEAPRIHHASRWRAAAWPLAARAQQPAVPVISRRLAVLSENFPTAHLLLVADIVDADGRARTILDRFIAGHIGRTQNRHLAIVRVTRFDGFQRRPG